MKNISIAIIYGLSLCLSGCDLNTGKNKKDNAAEIFIPSKIAETFSPSKINEYSLEQLDKFYTSGTSEATLKRCQRAINSTLLATSSQFVEWCELAAQENQTYAYAPLAHKYEIGEGVEKDDVKAIEYYLRAAKSGDIFADLAVANLYLKSSMGIADYKKARDFAEKALSANQNGAAIILASMSYNGLGAKRSITECYAYAAYGINITDSASEGDINVNDNNLGELNYLKKLCWNEIPISQQPNAENVLNNLSKRHVITK